MARICRECGAEVKILGTGYYGDTIEVECQNTNGCGEVYEIEPDGFDEGGLEMVDAQMIELEKNNKET